MRVSEYESITTALTLAGRIDWVWVDCFTRFPLTSQEAQQLGAAGFKLCIVSPELQGRDATVEVPALATLLRARGIRPDAGLQPSTRPVEARGLRRVKMLSLHPLFFVGAAIRLGLVLALAPVALIDWYAPFIAGEREPARFRPLERLAGPPGVTPSPFPTGYVMWLAFLPSAWLAEALALPAQYGYWLTPGSGGRWLAVQLHRLVPGMPTHRLLTWYWLSPIVLLATYGHGLNDLVPILLLTIALVLMRQLPQRRRALAPGPSVRWRFPPSSAWSSVSPSS